MLNNVEFQNWKSYKKSTLYFDPLTVLIGTNSSGKSNALDALLLLKRLADGVMLKSALAGDQSIQGIRGGLEWACLKPSSEFTLSVVSGHNEDSNTEYHFSITIGIHDNQPFIVNESLKRVKFRANSKKKPYQIWLYKTEPVSIDEPYITAKLYNEKRGTPRPSARGSSIISQLLSQKVRKEISEGINTIVNDLKNIFILDPIPSHMRSYTPLSENLETDASNVAGVLAALELPEKQSLESTITEYVQHLPEKDIKKIYAEKVGKFGSDAMLYCDEDWKGGEEPHTIDARGMSDGTLRFIAIITALLTRPEKSTLIVEEIDNGLHPSRANILVKILKEISQKRSIDILITTHNPTLLDEFGSEIVPFVTIAHRSQDSGESELTLLEDIDSLPKLLASGPVGTLSSRGYLEATLRNCGKMQIGEL
ncbi:AAA family ATPase [Vibrio cholerae]|uniref:AAA family ATPase n=1 Tax=Vibrio parahaemolyticus TaxID=670 RepID=UPI0025543EA4|nr:ATP-binding protein [Vibrio parahaemolyticus]HDY8158165.1 ATP-binding protein [Vibrio vulnificus]